MKAGTYSSEQERKAAQFQGDGLLDIGLGLALLIVGLAIYGEWSMSLVGIWVILWMFAGRAAKRKITLPRLELVDFSPSPESDRRRGLLKKFTLGLILVVFLLSLLLFAFGDWLPGPYQGWSEDSSALFIGLIGLAVLGILGMAGWATGARRLLVYAGLGVLGGIAAFQFGASLPLVLVALGGIILAAGILLLSRFLKEYPLQAS